MTTKLTGSMLRIQQTKMTFDWHFGIAVSLPMLVPPLKRVEVFATDCEVSPSPVRATPWDEHNGWTLEGITDWLVRLVDSEISFIAGINHRLSFPSPFCEDRNLLTWLDVLAASLTDNSPCRSFSGFPDNRRQTERWGTSLTSMFNLRTESLYADARLFNLSWLKSLRDRTHEKLHIWPFDGWSPNPGQSVLVECYAPCNGIAFPDYYKREGEQNAYIMAKWLARVDLHRVMKDFLCPKLPDQVRQDAAREGWILGVT